MGYRNTEPGAEPPKAAYVLVRHGAYDPADTLRFFTHRLHEVGMVRSSPNQIIDDGSDWRFVEELKQEMKT